MRLTVWVEKMTNGQLWGRTSSVGGTFVTGFGETLEALVANIRTSMISYQQKEEGQDDGWADMDINAIEFDIKLKES